MPNHTQPTLDDVAQKAGVSTATVSRVLNAPQNVREGTRIKVQRAIEELGYAPNFGARALAAKQTKIIGAVIPTMENAIFATGLQTFQETLDASGFTLLVSSSAYQRELEERQIRNLVSRGADAVLLIGDDRDPLIYEFLNKRNLPYVIAWNYRKNPKHHYVGFDNFVAAREMMEFVIKAGHREIGIISGVTNENDRARDRLRGFRRAALDANLSQPAEIEIAYDLDAAGDAFEKMIRSNQLTAIICGNDVLAVGAMIRARKLGIQIPQELSITGFDDIEISRIISPTLTTLHVPHRQMGRHAAEMIIERLQTGKWQESIELESYIVERDSLIHASR